MQKIFVEKCSFLISRDSNRSETSASAGSSLIGQFVADQKLERGPIDYR